MLFLIYSLFALLIFTILFFCVQIDKNNNRKMLIVLNGTTLESIIVLPLRSLSNKRVGLLNHLALNENEVYLFPNVKKIHTRGMQFNIAVVFLNSDGRILEIAPEVNPGIKSVNGPAKTKSILELNPSLLKKHNFFKRGDSVTFKKLT